MKPTVIDDDETEENSEVTEETEGLGIAEPPEGANEEEAPEEEGDPATVAEEEPEESAGGVEEVEEEDDEQEETEEADDGLGLLGWLFLIVIAIVGAHSQNENDVSQSVSRRGP